MTDLNNKLSELRIEELRLNMDLEELLKQKEFIQGAEMVLINQQAINERIKELNALYENMETIGSQIAQAKELAAMAAKFERAKTKHSEFNHTAEVFHHSKEELEKIFVK